MTLCRKRAAQREPDMVRMMVVAVLVAVAAASRAPAQDEQQWGFITTAGDARLFYGVPDSHDTALSLICQPKRKRIEIVSVVLPAKAVAGQHVTIRLTNGSASREYSGRIVRHRDDTYASASTALAPALFDLLRTGTSLRLVVASASEDIPLTGLAEPLAQMDRTCLGKR
jgi:hypothetical protein